MSSSASFSKNLSLSSTLKMEEEALVTKKQGIVSILGSDICETKAASLRRTLSADMSSKKWLNQDGFSPLKKIASSEEFAVSITDLCSSSEGEEEEDYEERKELNIWTSIEKEKKEEVARLDEKPGQFDIWSSIISQNAKEDSNNDNKPLPPPYIHPQVKRSTSSLNEKSLEICTESLGSETGSDGFSSYPPSETGDMEEDKDNQEQDQQQPEDRAVDVDEKEPERPVIVNKYNYVVGKKLPQRSFPPPIPSLSRQDGASLRMRTHRDNGRLVLEAVSVPSQSNFRAQRQDGRLVLTFTNTNTDDQQEYYSEDGEMNKKDREGKELEELEEEFGNFEEDKYQGEETEEEEFDDEEGETENESVENKEMGSFVMEQAPKLSSGVINVHRLAKLMMNKPTGVPNSNPTIWPNKFNEVAELGEEKEVEELLEPTTPLAKSLPPRPRVARMIPSQSSAVTAAAASFNAYDYYWRPTKPMTKGDASLNPSAQHPPPLKLNNSSNKLIISKSPIANQQQQLVVLRGNKGSGDDLVPLFCKESKRSLLFWERYCIATS